MTAVVFILGLYAWVLMGARAINELARDNADWAYFWVVYTTMAALTLSIVIYMHFRTKREAIAAAVAEKLTGKTMAEALVDKEQS